MSLGTDVSGSVMGTVGQMGNTAVNVVFRLIDLLRWLSEQRAKNVALMSGETDMESLQKFIDNSRDGKGTVSMPRTELEMFKAQAASHGVSFVIADGGDSNTIDVTFAKGRDGEAINQIYKNMAQLKLNENSNKWLTDRDLNGIDPEIADRVFRKNDIEQFSFGGADGRFTIYNRDMAEAYMLSKNEARALSADINKITVKPVNESFFSALNGTESMIELDKNEAQAINFLLESKDNTYDRDNLGIRFYKDGDKVLMSFDPSAEHDVMILRGDYKAAHNALNNFNIQYSGGISITDSRTNQILKPISSDVQSMVDELSLTSNNPMFKNQMFSYLCMERVNDTLFNSDDAGARFALHSFGFDNMKREIYFDSMSDIASYKVNVAIAKELRLAQNLTPDSKKSGVLIFDRAQNSYAVVPYVKASDVMMETFGYNGFKAGVLRDKIFTGDNPETENILRDFETNNPLLKNCKYDVTDNQMFIVNNINDKVMWINFNEGVPRTDIEKGITDKLGITDRTAVAELMNSMDRENYIPSPGFFTIDNIYTVSATTTDFVSITDSSGFEPQSYYLPKAEASPERIALKLRLDIREDKTLLETLTKACNPPTTEKAYKSFARHIEDANKAINKERNKRLRSKTQEINLGGMREQ